MEALTRGRRFWVGIASNQTYRRRWKDPKYEGFLNFALVFETAVDEERRCMEAHLIGSFNRKTYNEVNGGGGPKAGASPLYVYVVY